MAIFVIIAMAILAIHECEGNHTVSSCEAIPWLHSCEANKYDKTVPPQFAINGGTTNVRIEIYVESIGNFKAGTMDYDLDIYFVEFWKDERLTHNYSDYLYFNDRKQLDKIWMPDLYFANSKSAEYNYVTVPNMALKLYPDGEIRYSVRLNLKISCHMNLEAYPIDHQKCHIKIVTYGNTIELVNATWLNDNPITKDEAIRETDLKVVKIKADICDGRYFNWTYSCLLGTFYLERNIVYSLLQVYIPTTFIVVISWMSFWIDPTSVPGRVALAVTTLLTLSTQAIGLHYQLPPVSYAKAQDIWFAVCILFLFAALVEFAMVNMYTRRCDEIAARQKAADFKRRRGGLTGNKVELLCEAANVKEMVYGQPANGQPTKPFLLQPDDPLLLNDAWLQSKRIAINIDRYSRIIFPFIFICFCIAYAFGYRLYYARSY